jgi:spore coat protein U domain-containing protein, fimbrial subunit CupE1/2/3/6
MRMTTGLDILSEVAFVEQPANATTSAGETIQYKLYMASGNAMNWGNTVGTGTVGTIGDGASQSRTIYVPPQTTPTVGSYLDAMTVTVTY